MTQLPKSMLLLCLDLVYNLVFKFVLRNKQHDIASTPQLESLGAIHAVIPDETPRCKNYLPDNPPTGKFPTV